ncbi:transcription initiation factor TFIID subunit 4-like [Mirounga leonina]|uniref:transcription initiation factor TFIID subunit 4-like n=1 Tax=Mirounga leonina TaxID=9715 RepID=UPI00156C0C59|nr:transcription initiation factor TFIID subunit 4-like [Mirounga leonina]
MPARRGLASSSCKVKLGCVPRGGPWKVFAGGRGVASVPGERGGAPAAPELGLGGGAGSWKAKFGSKRKNFGRGVGKGGQAEASRSPGDGGQALGPLALRTALPHPALGGLSAPTGRALARASGPLPASAPPARAALPLHNSAAPGPGRKCPAAPPRPALSCFPRWPLEASLSSVTPACPSPAHPRGLERWGQHHSPISGAGGGGSLPPNTHKHTGQKGDLPFPKLVSVPPALPTLPLHPPSSPYVVNPASSRLPRAPDAGLSPRCWGGVPAACVIREQKPTAPISSTLSWSPLGQGKYSALRASAFLLPRVLLDFLLSQ